MNINNKRIESIQYLRCLAFFGVFLGHAGIGSGALGALGVSIFLMLSGFLLCLKYISSEECPKNGITFAFHKIKKLYPLHLTILFFCFLYELIIKTNIKQKIIPFILQIFIIQIWWPDESVYANFNNPSWYLGVCFFCYLMFPLLYKLTKNKYKSVKDAIIAVAGLVLLECILAIFAKQFLSDNYSDFFSMKYFLYFFPPSRLIDFAIGMNLGYVYAFCLKDKNFPLWGWITFSIVTATTIIISCTFYNCSFFILGKQYVKYTLQFLLPAMMLVLFFVMIKKTSNNLIFIALKWGGDISLYAFLIHMAVIKYIKLIINNIWIQASVSLTVTVLLSFAWSKIEKNLFKKER